MEKTTCIKPCKAAKKDMNQKIFTSELVFYWSDEGVFESCGINIRYRTGPSPFEGDTTTRRFLWSVPRPNECADIIFFEMKDTSDSVCDAILLSPEVFLYPEEFAGIVLEQPHLMVNLFDRHKRSFNMWEQEKAFSELAHIRITGRAGTYKASYMEGT